MTTRSIRRRRPRRRSGFRGALDDALLSLRTAGWLGRRLGGPALRETYRHRRARRR